MDLGSVAYFLLLLRLVHSPFLASLRLRLRISLCHLSLLSTLCTSRRLSKILTSPLLPYDAAWPVAGIEVHLSLSFLAYFARRASVVSIVLSV